jgi:hypothetical protein
MKIGTPVAILPEKLTGKVSGLTAENADIIKDDSSEENAEQNYTLEELKKFKCKVSVRKGSILFKYIFYLDWRRRRCVKMCSYSITEKGRLSRRIIHSVRRNGDYKMYL